MPQTLWIYKRSQPMVLVTGLVILTTARRLPTLSLCLEMLAHAGLEKTDIAYASFEAGFYETPYCIIIDRKWRSIVLSIRGSLSLEDCIVDILVDPTPLDALGEKYGFDGVGQCCHGGVLACSNWLHEDLMRYDT